MTKKLKLFMVDEKPYLVSLDKIEIGDKAIVTVGELYPTFVECQNDDQINLFQKPKTSMTKRHKVVMMGEELILENEILSLLSEREGPLTVTYENGEIKVVTEM